ncbi:MAG TPA: phage holin family protein [Vulgatibacter sp.]|nr:phage holin family protein [Vulgatibacter sp.]
MRAPNRPLSELPLGELFERLIGRSRLLAQQEVELAKTEARAQLRTEAKTAAGLSIAAICALLAVAMMLVAVALLLDIWLAGWLSALLVAAFVLAVGSIAGLLGWRTRVRDPMGTTRRTMEGNIRWLKERRA